jgi:hypothetical protein
MAKSMVQIKDDALTIAKDLGLKVDADKLLATIKGTRCCDDSKTNYPNFSTGMTTGCNPRLALSFYLQLEAKVPTFNPEFELTGPKAKKGLAKKSA